MPTANDFRKRLIAGERREAQYGYWVPGGHVSGRDMLDKLKARAVDAAGLRCYLHGEPIISGDLHLDHVRPLAAAGHHLLWNLEPACARCNISKNDTVLPWEPPLDNFQPLYKRLLAMPVEDLWNDADPNARRLVNSFIREPRPVPIDPSGWRLKRDTDIVAALLDQRDPYQAMPLGQIAQKTSISAGALDNHYWARLMGTSITRNNTNPLRRLPHNRRFPPHPLLVPTRDVPKPGAWGTKAFRLRFRFPLSTIGAWFQGTQIPDVYLRPNDRRFPDHDERNSFDDDVYDGANNDRDSGQ